MELVDRVGYRQGVDELWFAGDLVNRGPASARVLETAMELGARTVLGNHDLHLLRRAAGNRGAAPLDTCEDVLDSVRSEELIGWLRGQPLVKAWDDVLLVHAGLNPSWEDPEAVARRLENGLRNGSPPWDDPDLDFLTAVRYCDADGRRPERGNGAPTAPFAPWDEHYSGERTVVFGHWAARGKVERDRIRGLDTGCVWGRSLTAWIAEEDRFVSVPAQRAYQQVQ